MGQLLSYIAHAAPATRRPATGSEPFLRPEIGFVPSWYSRRMDIDFGERWHTDPEYRRTTIVAMARETKKRFGDLCDVGIMQDPDSPADLLTGTYGTTLVAGLYGAPIRYVKEDWPWIEHSWSLDDESTDDLQPPELESNQLWSELMAQIDWIERNNGPVWGFMNWQGVLNNAFRLRGNAIFRDMALAPERVEHIFDCVAETMTTGAKLLYQRQAESGVEIRHFTLSNCLVNMISPRQYGRFQLPLDRRIARSFWLVGIHNCAWRADPYMDLYSTIPRMGYIDMGMESDLRRARELFPKTRRAIMYSPADIREKPIGAIASDLERIASQYGPCDVVLADIPPEVPDSRVSDLLQICDRLSRTHQPDR